MPRYFFDVHDTAFTPDEDGTDLPDLAAAGVAAVELAGNVLKEGAETFFWDGGDWQVRVRDEGGAMLFALHFNVEASDGEALPPGSVFENLRSANDPGEP